MVVAAQSRLRMSGDLNRIWAVKKERNWLNTQEHVGFPVWLMLCLPLKDTHRGVTARPLVLGFDITMSSAKREAKTFVYYFYIL